MCSPAKRLAPEVDVLDLSRKSFSPASPFANGNYNVSNVDVIVLSEDEDKPSPISSDTEKENNPHGKDPVDGKILLIRLENELRQEEYTLMLLQKLRDSQKSSSPQPTKHYVKSSNSVQVPIPNPQGNITHASAVSTGVTVAVQKNVPVSQPSKAITPTQQTVPQNSAHPAPKVTKVAALQSLEQQCNAKKSVLKKQLERSLEKIPLPRPSAGTGLCEIAFIPSTLTSEFTSLLGLEEVVKNMQEFDPSSTGSQPEPRRTFSPFSCVKCGIDFTPVWKREKVGSSTVICEACLAGTQRSSLQKEYENSVKQVLQQNGAAEREIEREYQEIIANPTKLENYIREQEKKLLATHQAQLAQQQQLAQQAAAQAHSQRYQTKQSVGAQNTGLRTPTHQVSSPCVNNANINGSNNASHQRSRQGTSTPLSNSPVATPAASVTLPQQHLSAAAAAASQHFTPGYQQQQQLTKPTVSVGANAVNTAALMMAATANPALLAATATNQQQQQQRLAAAVLSGLQQQQPQQAQSAVADQFAQIQALFMNSLLLGGSPNNQGSATSRQQLIQQAIQYNLLLQQQQQQAAAAQQAQQAAAAAAQQAQQNALLQLVNALQSNPAAYWTLLQNLLLMGAATNPAGSSGSANKK
uniref:GATA-type domain-containing protein n=1 Tax=Schistocephalus solidus TaxID=70667 RepID=A0A0X3Q2U7_SCHSO